MEFEIIILIIAYLIPMYVANATPIIFHGRIPVDLGKTINGKRVLGKGKTILGALCGIIGGVLVGFLFMMIFPGILFLIPNYFLLVLLLSAGAILGDMTKSFFKRKRQF